jgi:hypothetical protein
VCLIGMTACGAEQTGGSSRWRAILVAGENVEQATSDCLLACLVFEDTETGARCRIGCDTSCDNHFGCTHPGQLGGVRHCCEFVTQVSGRHGRFVLRVALSCVAQDRVCYERM